MAGMPATATHRIIAADAYSVPKPFRGFAVRSDEPRHAHDARSPYAQVHVLGTSFLDADALARMAAQGHARTRVDEFADVDYATTTLAELAALAPDVDDLVGAIAGALQATGVLGDDLADYRRSVATRIDYLASHGAGFHNDVDNHWTRCLFWILALAVADVEFVMPHAGVRVALAPGDLVVFDQTMAHGLCRPGDRGQAISSSFEGGVGCRQMFLTGEIELADAQWAVLGAPWLPVEEHARRGALDLMAAEFDERSGAIKRLGALRHRMQRDEDAQDIAGEADNEAAGCRRREP